LWTRERENFVGRLIVWRKDGDKSRIVVVLTVVVRSSWIRTEQLQGAWGKKLVGASHEDKRGIYIRRTMGAAAGCRGGVADSDDSEE